MSALRIEAFQYKHVLTCLLLVSLCSCGRDSLNICATKLPGLSYLTGTSFPITMRFCAEFQANLGQGRFGRSGDGV